MKQCPVCKTNYTDETLNYCLADGTALSVSASEPETVLMNNFDKNPMRINIPNQTAANNAPPVTSPNQTVVKTGVSALIVVALVGLLLLVMAAFAGFIIYSYSSKPEIATVNSDNKNAVSTGDNKNSRNVNTISEKPVTTPSPRSTNSNTNANIKPFPSNNSSGTPTAKVKPTGDGFLSLRTEPSVKTGTQLVKIPSGSTVNLENCEKNTMIIDSRKGRWCMVSYNNQTGWVFDAFLTY